MEKKTISKNKKTLCELFFFVTVVVFFLLSSLFIIY